MSKYVFNIWLWANLVNISIFLIVGWYYDFHEEIVPLIFVGVIYSVPVLLIGLVLLTWISSMSVKPVAKLYTWILSIAFNLSLVAVVFCFITQGDANFIYILLIWSIPVFIAAAIASILLRKQFYQLLDEYEY